MLLSVSFAKRCWKNFKYYRVPVIALDQSTSKEAVCVVFEKVNTGGKPLDAFELVTAMYAADGHELRKDWYGSETLKGRHSRLQEALRPATSDAGDAGEREQHRLPTHHLRFSIPASVDARRSRRASKARNCQQSQGTDKPC